MGLVYTLEVQRGQLAAFVDTCIYSVTHVYKTKTNAG